MRFLLISAFCFAAFVPFTDSRAQTSSPDTLKPEQCILRGDDRIVPNILGFSPEDAQKIIETCGFIWDGATDVHTMSYEAIGKVGDQEPSGGTIRKAKTTVRGFISNGMFAPNFIGWSKIDAERYIRDLRHGVTIKEDRNAAPIGTVFDQIPKNAEKYNSGLAVTIYVSLGLYVDIPDLSNVHYTTAVNRLKGLKLSPTHGGGDLSEGSNQITNCELTYWYPVVDRIEPSGRVYEADSIRIYTRRETQFQFGIPKPGVICR